MSAEKCKRCGAELIADGTEDADWRTICEECEFEQDELEEMPFDCDHDEFTEDILTGRCRCDYCGYVWSRP